MDDGPGDKPLASTKETLIAGCHRGALGRGDSLQSPPKPQQKKGRRRQQHLALGHGPSEQQFLREDDAQWREQHKRDPLTLDGPKRPNISFVRLFTVHQGLPVKLDGCCVVV